MSDDVAATACENFALAFERHYKFELRSWSADDAASSTAVAEAIDWVIDAGKARGRPVVVVLFSVQGGTGSPATLEGVRPIVKSVLDRHKEALKEVGESLVDELATGLVDALESTLGEGCKATVIARRRIAGDQRFEGHRIVEEARRSLHASGQQRPEKAEARFERLLPAQADERFSLADVIPHYRSLAHPWVHVYGSEHLDQDLILDEDVNYVFDGDLSVRDVVNTSSDSGCFLVVIGSLSARNLIGGGSTISVRGDAVLRGCLFGHGNDGIIEVRGRVRALAILGVDDHDIRLGTADAPIVAAHLKGADLGLDALLRKLVGAGGIREEPMIAHLRKGRSPLRKR